MVLPATEFLMAGATTSKELENSDILLRYTDGTSNVGRDNKKGFWEARIARKRNAKAHTSEKTDNKH